MTNPLFQVKYVYPDFAIGQHAADTSACRSQAAAAQAGGGKGTSLLAYSKPLPTKQMRHNRQSHVVRGSGNDVSAA